MSQTVDNLAQLEQRVEGLIQQIEATQRTNLELREENLRLKQEIEGLSNGQRENAALQGEVDRLNEELTTMSGREGLIRERLQGMLEKIDSIEKEIQTSPATAD
jgi:predicted nuclease with TOPRIM domain